MCTATLSRSAWSSSTAVVTVARTRPAAASASASNSSAMPAICLTRFDSISSRARLVACGSNTWGVSEMSSMRRPTGIVGLVRTAATAGSDSRSRTVARRWPHSSICRSSVARSKTARAYRLAAAVATSHLGYRSLDELLVLSRVEGLADDFLSRRHDEARNLIAHRLDRLASGCRKTFGLLFRFLLELLAQLLSGLGRAFDYRLRGLARLCELRLGLFESRFSFGA